jgi:hypothetical protein
MPPHAQPPRPQLPLDTLPRGFVGTSEFYFWWAFYTHLILEWPWADLRGVGSLTRDAKSS